MYVIDLLVAVAIVVCSSHVLTANLFPSPFSVTTATILAAPLAKDDIIVSHTCLYVFGYKSGVQRCLAWHSACHAVQL